MKATCIAGSARSNGSTSYLIDTISAGMREAGIDVTNYYIGKENIHYCLGCKKCYTDGKCVHNDIVKQIVSDIVSSDFVVMAAPSYWADVPGQLKTFFDRNTPYGDTNPNRILRADKPIKGIAIAVRAGVRQQENELILNSIQHYYGHLGIETVKRISICETDTLEDLKTKHHDVIGEIYQLGKNITTLLHSSC